MSLRRLVVLLS